MSNLPKIIETVAELQQWRRTQHQGTIGFVPTMGALHEGHASLLRRAREENSLVVLSIFINPTQFNQHTDLAQYPRTWEQDLALAQAAGVDVIFAPSELYPDSYRYQVSEKEFSKILCGAHRPGHFEGMLTVVLKLFNLVKPDRAYFGEKDYQQLRLIQGMVEALFLDVEIVPCPTLREASGLALSSRNLRLSPADRQLASNLYAVLCQAISAESATKKLERLGFEVEYLTDYLNGHVTGWGADDSAAQRGRRMVAAWLGGVRLIDNVELSPSPDFNVSEPQESAVSSSKISPVTVSPHKGFKAEVIQ